MSNNKHAPLPTLAEVTARWATMNEREVPMLFTAHVQRDILVLLARIVTLEEHVRRTKDFEQLRASF